MGKRGRGNNKEGSEGEKLRGSEMKMSLVNENNIHLKEYIALFQGTCLLFKAKLCDSI